MHYLIYSFLLFVFFCHPLGAQESVILESDFSKNQDGWMGSFTDYPAQGETFYELSYGWENLPTPLDSWTKGLFISGNNHSDDLFMFFKKEITGLKPNTEYALLFSFIIETNVPKSHVGIGGSPGESVYVKAGASTEEPSPVLRNQFYYLNVDKGNQAQGGLNAMVVGNLASETVDPHHRQYQPKHLTNEGHPLLVKTDQNGSLWIFVGTDSGFEGATKFYLVNIKVSAS